MSPNRKKTLLIIDDDRYFCYNIAEHLSDREYDISSVHSLAEAQKILKCSEVDVLLLDQKLPDGSGIDLCKSIVNRNEQIKIIFITAYPSFDNAIEALRNGAYDYLSKPLEIEEVALAVNQAFRTQELETVEQLQNYKERLELDRHVLIGKSSGLKETYNLVKLAAANDAPVLLTGETGTGKNVIAKAIHYSQSTAYNKCFLSINCAALPENLIEAELFGYEKGSFTGADSAKKGIFELAHEGTLFLDEIGDLPIHLQSKLLGVLDDHQIKRLGGQTYKKVSVRIIAATNVDLNVAVENKSFRQDLYYRLSVFPIHIPPLRNRLTDIQEFCNHFMDTLAVNQHITLPPQELNNLQSYSWPGNVRELKNVIERALIFQRDRKIFPSEILKSKHENQPINAPGGRHILSLDEMEKKHILNALDLMQHNHTQTAKILGISRSTLLRKLKKYSVN